jgi:molybdate transport system regulatory protein
MIPKTEIKLRLLCGTDIAFGPGKADLLDAIARTGSISAAARHLGMSYRRAWLLVDAMNRCFRAPLVETAAGGRQGGGAQVSQTGRQVLEGYRRMQALAAAAVRDEAAQLEAMLAPRGAD